MSAEPALRESDGELPEGPEPPPRFARAIGILRWALVLFSAALAVTTGASCGADPLSPPAAFHWVPARLTGTP